MALVPMEVQTRPFAVEPVTGVMLPDGIFDNALYKLLVSCHYTNTSGSALNNVSVYLESVGDPGIVVTANTVEFEVIPAGASVLVQWEADFENASPGKPLVSFVAEADGLTSARSLQQIFVSQTRYDAITAKWTCTVPEGRLEVSHLYATKLASVDQKKSSFPRPRAVTGVDMAWFANPSFSGQFGELPFSDPWWKILALIVAALAAIVGAIAAAAGGGTFNLGGGTFDDDPSGPSVHCCTPDPAGTVAADATVAGVCGLICTGALIVACSDEADPIYRGESNTVPQADELTTSETVEARWRFIEPPNAGMPYKTKVKWQYERITTGANYQYAVEEEQTNIHVVKNVVIDTPSTVARPEPLWAKVQFEKPDGSLFTGPELYTICFFRAPGAHGVYIQVPLLDDGLGMDVAANDGTFTASLNLDKALRSAKDNGGQVLGEWRLYVYAQEVNRTAPGTAPVVAAQTIGGSVVTSAVDITFDPNLPCPFKAQATIEVV